MESTAFITLEDISDQLPSYEESVLTVDMDGELAKAYEEIEKDITSAMRQHRGNKSLMGVMLNTLLLYPDHPFRIEEIWGKQYDPKEGCMVPFFVTNRPASGNRGLRRGVASDRGHPEGTCGGLQ